MELRNIWNTTQGRFSLQCQEWTFPISAYPIKFHWPEEMKLFSYSQEKKQMLGNRLKSKTKCCVDKFLSPNVHVPPC